MADILPWLVLPVIASCWTWFARANAERDRGTAWGDVLLRACTRAVIVFVGAVLLEIAGLLVYIAPR